MNILFYLVPKSEVMYLYDDFSLRQALEKMEYHKYGSVPIINRAGNYVGTLTEGDIMNNPGSVSPLSGLRKPQIRF